MTHPALQPGNAAVVTGAASGIGLAAAHRLAALGLNVMLSDRPGAALDRAKEDVAARASNRAQIHAFAADVADPAQLVALREAAFERFDGVSVLMNNAAIGSNPGKPWEAPDA
jgi:NAD(P)-dependent dehydrogenase (short-subunit alcohol dehydrogenase family)